MKNKPRVLFVCTKRGARSRIAEAFLKQAVGDAAEVFSSCFEDGKISPLVVAAMQEKGIQLNDVSPKSVFQRKMDKEVFDFVVSLCQEGTEICPVFKDNVDVMYADESVRIQWDIPDFSSLTGSQEDILKQARVIRDEIERKVNAFIPVLHKK